MSPPDERSMDGCSRAAYSKKRTHDYGWVRNIGQPRNITGIRYNVDPAKLHVDPEDVAESAVYNFISVSRHGGLLESDICVILRPCIEALVGFHALGGDACLRGKSVCQKVPSSNVNYRDIAEAE
jgi:hypothetical protein